MIVVIKYGKGCGFVEKEVYDIKFDYAQSRIVVASTPDGLLHDELEDAVLKKLDGEVLKMEYLGISRIDDRDIFLIDIIAINRTKLINSILNE